MKPEPTFDWEELDRRERETFSRENDLGGFTTNEFGMQHGVGRSAANARVEKLIAAGVVKRVGYKRVADSTGRRQMAACYDFVAKAGE